MTKRTLFVWVIIIVFGLASMPVVGFAALSKQTGNTEVLKKKPKKKGSKKKSKKNKRVNKKKKGSKKLKSGGKKNHSKKSGKKKKYSGKKKKYSKKRSSRKSSKRKYYAPPTNSNKVEYRNYQRNTDENTSGSEMNIEKIAPSKEIKKEPKKEGEQ